ncbi:helix-turn-helix domain-containing protein [Amycolatopsis alba]|uniref:XRE family transcriptional regulator n=1 Tax=Amycolatopsis alba DSM 44262 TaxID=1125972 RepID=A0A229R8Z2_AMYAL|nr:helix-turn-helix transcriptional regulator [Amycolatopsis alba]OXM43055.1 XRE family transcriptional regulator [Amycolatopsis alba DSM 44262]
MTEAARRVGGAIRAKRIERGLSQGAFGKLIGRSGSWVGQVERGDRKIDRMSVLEKISEVAGIPIADLMSAAAFAAASPGKPLAVSELAMALLRSSGLRFGLRRPSEPKPHARHEPASLIERAAQAWELVHGSSYDTLAKQLLDLLPELETAVRATDGEPKKALYTALASAYHTAAAVLSKLDEPAAAWVAADRAISAAEHTGDPMLVAAGAFRLTLAFQSARSLELAWATAEDADEALTAFGTTDPVAVSLRGALKLQLAVIASRLGDADTAYAQLDLAHELAERNGRNRNDHGTEFGPANVGVHEVTIALALGDSGRALRVGEALDVSGLSVERRARLLIDLARAHAQRRNLAGVVAALTAADDLAPQQVRTHPAVRTLLSDLGETTAANDDEAFTELKTRLATSPIE